MALKVSFNDNEIANYLRLDYEVDADLIDSMAQAATDEAQEFLNNNFEDEHGEAQEAPASIKLWILNRIAELYENRGKAPKPDFSAIKLHRIYPFRG